MDENNEVVCINDDWTTAPNDLDDTPPKKHSVYITRGSSYENENEYYFLVGFLDEYLSYCFAPLSSIDISELEEILNTETVEPC